MTSPRLILFSGLGCGPELVARQRGLPFEVVVPRWLRPASGEPLVAYARRMAGTVDARPGDVLGGVSLGGAIALEAAHVLRPRAVVIVSSARSGASIAWQWRASARMTPVTPPWLVRGLLTVSPAVYPLIGVRRPDDRRTLRNAIWRVDVHHYRWGALAMERWALTAPPPCPVHHVHGERDLVIPARKVRADAIIRGAGHAAFITHADAVNAVLESVVTGR